MLKRFLAPAFILFGAASGKAALAEPSNLTPVEAYERVAHDGLKLIDVRTPGEWVTTGVAKGARTATLQDTDFMAQIDFLTGGDKSAPVALICRSGARSGRAASKLAENGYTMVYNVTGGTQQWIADALPLEDHLPN